MPQRLSNVKPNAKGILFDNLAGPGRNRPELAQLAAQVISEWSLLDTYFSGLFVAMIGANPKPGAAVYSNFTATATQVEAMRTVAAITLDDVLCEVLEALLDMYRKRGTERNRVGHWVWGHTPDLPDKVLLVNPAHFATYHAEFVYWESAMMRNRKPPKEPGIPFDEVWVYGKQDFVDISERLQRLIMLTARFRNLVRAHMEAPNPGMTKTLQFFERLSALLKEPELHACANRMNERQRKSQEAPQQSPPGSPPQK